MEIATQKFQKLDIVQIGSRHFIIVDYKPERHVYPYVGILANGKGAPYKLSPTKHGTMAYRSRAAEDHPAYLAYLSRTGKTSDSQIDATYKKLVDRLVDAVLADDQYKAKTIAIGLREIEDA